MLLYKVCLSHQYLRFEPNFNLVGQFWKKNIEKLGLWVKKAPEAPLMPIRITPKRSGGFSHLEGPKWAWEANIERKLKTWAVILYRSTKRDIQLYFRPLLGNTSFTKLHYKMMQYQCIFFGTTSILNMSNDLSTCITAQKLCMTKAVIYEEGTCYQRKAIFEKIYNISEEMSFFSYF